MSPFSGPKTGPQKVKVHSGPSPFVAPFWGQKTDAKKGPFSWSTCGLGYCLRLFHPPAYVTGTACMDGSEPSNYRLNVCERE